MKDQLIPVARPGMGRQMPTPQIKTAVVQQAVDLKPVGATVAITTIADNPFEARQPVKVVTQASGGMAAAAPAPRPSRGIMHSMLPGLGESSTAEVSEGWEATAQRGVTSAVDTALTREERKRAEYEAQIADAEARQEEARTRGLLATAGSATRKGILSTSIDLFGMKINLPMLAAGGGLLWFALKKRKKSRKGRK